MHCHLTGAACRRYCTLQQVRTLSLNDQTTWQQRLLEDIALLNKVWTICRTRSRYLTGATFRGYCTVEQDTCLGYGHFVIQDHATWRERLWEDTALLNKIRISGMDTLPYKITLLDRSDFERILHCWTRYISRVWILCRTRLRYLTGATLRGHCTICCFI
jgi:hypothetical protein